MRLPIKKNNCLLPLFFQSAFLLAQDGAELHLNGSDWVSVNNTQLVGMEEGSIDYQGEQFSFLLDENIGAELSIVVSSELAFFWNDYHITDLTPAADEKLWLLSIDCDDFGVPRTVKLQPGHRLITPSKSCLKSKKSRRWHFTSIVFKPQFFASVSLNKEMMTYDLLTFFSRKSGWLPGVIGSDSIGATGSWNGAGILPGFGGSKARGQLSQPEPQYVQLSMLHTPVDEGLTGEIGQLINLIMTDACSIDELYLLLQQLLGSHFRGSLTAFKNDIGYEKGEAVVTRWVLDYLQHFSHIFASPSRAKKEAAEAMTDEERESDPTLRLLRKLRALQEQQDTKSEPSEDDETDDEAEFNDFATFWHEAAVITSADISSEELTLMEALAESLGQNELISYVHYALWRQEYHFPKSQIRNHILDSFEQVSPLDLFRFIRTITNYAAQISYDLYDLLGPYPSLLSALRGLGVQYREDQLRAFRRQEQQARGRNRSHSKHFKGKKRV